ncbi:hypothetical protein P6144_11900 [Sphingomonas sp. HITSZ_GF]|uniref:hypothetical protein n=1 Tax=Sphingomonas sp. HITSZ_GF TaxID=3037247 RepID=UPI00240E4DA3|nr:hypothetical protein [Sphingomonas sp. HITSZ_GF]MDG2534356.1 hypothetical protein [Sphingomonas sp. HITSZ_GF]
MTERHDDREYFTLRATQERVIARACKDNAVALTHFRMADEYDRRAEKAKGPPPADI